MPLTKQTEAHADMVERAARGDARALFKLARTFCGPPRPWPMWCERLLRVAVDVETYQDLSKRSKSSEASGPRTFADPAEWTKPFDKKKGAVEFYLGTQFDAFTPGWDQPDATPEHSRCLNASEALARRWYEQVLFRAAFRDATRRPPRRASKRIRCPDSDASP